MPNDSKTMFLATIKVSLLDHWTLSIPFEKSNGTRRLKRFMKPHLHWNSPNFSTVVFQCCRPSYSSLGDLHCYTTSLESKQQLASFLDQAGLLQTAGGSQYLYIIEDTEKSVPYLPFLSPRGGVCGWCSVCWGLAPLVSLITRTPEQSLVVWTHTRGPISEAEVTGCDWHCRW